MASAACAAENIVVSTVIDIVAQVTDETASGARSAEANVSKLERSMMNLQPIWGKRSITRSMRYVRPRAFISFLRFRPPRHRTR